MKFTKSFWSLDGKREARIIAEIVTPPPISSFRIVCYEDGEVAKHISFHPIHTLERIAAEARDFVT